MEHSSEVFHRHSLLLGQGSGVGSFGSFRVACNRLLYQVIEVFTKSVYPVTS